MDRPADMQNLIAVMGFVALLVRDFSWQNERVSRDVRLIDGR